MVEKSPSEVVALCIESFSSTPVSLIRKVAGLADSDMPLSRRSRLIGGSDQGSGLIPWFP